MQLTLELVPPAHGHPDLESMRGLNLRPAVFYYVLRELHAGRGEPRDVKLTAGQRTYIHSFIRG